MKNQIKNVILAFVGVMLFFTSYGQVMPVVVEVESGTLGSDFTTGTDGDITYVEPQTDLINSTNPGDDSKIISFEITFPEAGSYDIYAKLNVGSGTYDDDSFFAANSLGTKSSITDGDWTMVNGLASAGYSFLKDVVNENGGMGSETWKWVNVTVFAGVSVQVDAGNLIQTYQIGARENGLKIDKLVFQQAGLYVTVSNLEEGEPGSVDEPVAEPIGPPLATGLDKFLGCGYGSDSQKDFEGYWNQLTPGNAGKWGSVEGTRDVMNWNALDEAYNLAKDNGMLYKHHVLVWGAQQPSWISALPASEQLEEIEEWFAAVAERYDSIDQIEVVNEPLPGHNPPDGTSERANYIEALGGTGTTGWDWIIKSFELARKYFPNTELLINEYGIINSTENTTKYLEIIKLLQDRNLIDGICFQGHGFSLNGSLQTMTDNLDAMAATGLPVYVAEMDVDGLTDKQQVTGFRNYFKLFWEHPGVEGITFWGYLPGMWRTDQGAYLFDEQGRARPAWNWMLAYLGDSLVTSTDINLTTDGGATEINVPGGMLQCTAEIVPGNVTLDQIVWSVSTKAVATIDENGLLTAVNDGTVTVYAATIDSDVKVSTKVKVSNQTIGIFKTGTTEIRVYPNPSVDGTISIKGIEDMHELKVFNMLGEQIYYQSLSGREMETVQLNVDLGMYIVQVSNNSEMIKKQILIK